MKHLIRAFLNDLGGNPNRRNGRGQTALHCVCSVSQQKSLSGEQNFYKILTNKDLSELLLPLKRNSFLTATKMSIKIDFSFGAAVVQCHFASELERSLSSDRSEGEGRG
jgi:hypothetical protein